MSGKMKCLFCEENLYRDSYMEHLETNHSYQYQDLLSNIIEPNNEGLTAKEIEKKLQIENKDLLCKLEGLRENSEEYNVSRPLKTSGWEPEKFKLEATTVWSFPNRGNWATHSGNYRGNWSPYIPRNIILRYSSQNDVVLDQFLGSGTTLVETKLLNRRGIGVDINKQAIKIAEENLRFNQNNYYHPVIHNGDARNLSFIPDSSVDLICTHPPYADIIKYSDNLEGDLSHYDIEEFIVEIKKVAKESFRVLRQGKYCAILIGDTRRNKHMIPLGFRVMQSFLDAGFLLKETIIKEQHNCKATGFWYKKSIDFNFLLIAHEYLFIFRKPSS